MGHTRLGELPRTRRWQEVVGLLGNGAHVGQVANATIAAAEKAFGLASTDTGLVETFWLLTQLPLAAKAPNYLDALQDAGVNVDHPPTIVELSGAFAEAIDRRVDPSGDRTDLGEMAEMAAVETLNSLLGQRTHGLFETTPTDVQAEIGRLGTRRQFSNLASQFFARLVERFLSYYLGRALPGQTGEGKRFATLQEQGEFDQALEHHCRQASRIVEEFSGGWFAKTNFEGGISRDKAASFVQVAMGKLVKELQYGARTDG